MGFTDTEFSAAGLTVKVAFEVVALNEALMFATAWVWIGVVMIVKVAVVWPGATVTVEGRLTEATLLESDTTTPFEPAVPWSTTVPLEGVPP